MTLKILLKLVDHLVFGEVLSEQELEQYDFNDDGLFDERDFITAYRKLLEGPEKERSHQNLLYFKKYAQNMTKNIMKLDYIDKETGPVYEFYGNLTENQFHYISDKIKKLSNKYGIAPGRKNRENPILSKEMRDTLKELLK